MTDPGRPRSIAIWKASRSLSRCAASSISAFQLWRLVSFELSEKCLTVDTTPTDCAPRTASARTRRHDRRPARGDRGRRPRLRRARRSEEHTSELQSILRISYAVFCLKKNTYHKVLVIHCDSINTNMTLL